MRTCSVESCDRKHWGKGYCQAHYTRLQRSGAVDAQVPIMVKGANGSECKLDGCSRAPHAHNLCISHLSRLRVYGDLRADEPLKPRREGCRVPGCERKHSAHGYCRLHARRVASFGSVDLPAKVTLVCAVATCERDVRANGYCNAHAERLRLRGNVRPDVPIRAFREVCHLAGCERTHYSLGFCMQHYQQRISKPRRRALEDSALGDVSAEQLQARIDYYGGCCWMCRAPWTCVDHVKPLSAGGCNWPANLRPACRSCNARKHNRWPYPTTTTALRKAA